MTEEHRNQEPSQEALERKQRSLEKLKIEGVPFISHLPVIEDSAEVKTRSIEEIAHRAIAVLISAVKGEGLEQGTIDSLVRKYGAKPFFSPEEARFIQEPLPTQQDRIKFSWRYECVWVLLWALGYVDTLGKPEGVCDVPKMAGIFRDRDSTMFIKDATLRPIAEILDQAELVYHYHWATRDAQLKGKPLPSGLDGGVVYERHYALNWLIGYCDQDWDEISTDT